MAPKKKEQQQKMSVGEFLNGAGFGGGSSWADEVEETYVTVGTQPLPPNDRSRLGGGGSSMNSYADRGYSVRERSPQRLPDKPPYTAHLGNLAYDVTNDAVLDFFQGCEPVNVRLIEDRELQRPKGFGYVEFATLDGLQKALALDSESFQGRTVRIKIADPPRGGDAGRGDSIRELGDWTRKGPLPDMPRSGGRQMSDFGGERRRDPALDGGRDGGRDGPRDGPREGAPVREARELNWERRGPLAPIASPEGSGSRDGSRPRGGAEGLGERGGSYRDDRRQSPAWGEGRPEGSRPPRPERPERPERVASAADKDMQWRERMRPDSAAAKSPEAIEPPASPALSSAGPAPGGRPRLNLTKRTVSEAPAVASSAASDSKASPFGAARPIDTAAKEKEIEEKKQQAIREKREADEKAKEEKRLAKEEAAKAEAEAQAEAEAKSQEQAANAEAKVDSVPPTPTTAAAPDSEEKQAPVRNREPREAPQNPKSRATEASSWRSAGGSRGAPTGGRGGRGGATRGSRSDRSDRPSRANGSGQQNQAPRAADSGDSEAAPTADNDGWTTVPNKKGRGGRGIAP